MKTPARLAASLVAFALPAMAQQHGAGQAQQAQRCTQMELSLGIRGDRCGKLSLAELAAMQTRRDNPLDRMDE